MLIEPVRVPLAVGLNVTLNVQLLPGVSVSGETGQRFATLKSPLKVIFEIRN